MPTDSLFCDSGQPRFGCPHFDLSLHQLVSGQPLGSKHTHGRLRVRCPCPVNIGLSLSPFVARFQARRPCNALLICALVSRRKPPWIQRSTLERQGPIDESGSLRTSSQSASLPFISPSSPRPLLTHTSFPTHRQEVHRLPARHDHKTSSLLLQDHARRPCCAHARGRQRVRHAADTAVLPVLWQRDPGVWGQCGRQCVYILRDV